MTETNTRSLRDRQGGMTEKRGMLRSIHGLGNEWDFITVIELIYGISYRKRPKSPFTKRHYKEDKDDFDFDGNSDKNFEGTRLNCCLQSLLDSSFCDPLIKCKF